MFILPHGTWKDNIRSVILNRRQGSTGHSSKGERSAGLSSERRGPLVSQAKGNSPLVAQAKGRGPLVTQAKGETYGSLKQTCHVCSPAVPLIHRKGLRHRRKICANSLWLYYYYRQPSPSKNKNVIYIFIYLRVLRCLSSGPVYNKRIRKYNW